MSQISAPMARKPGFVRALWAVYRKEIRVSFLSPEAYVFIAAFLFFAGIFFYLGLALTGEASLRTVLSNLAVVLLFFMPLVTMSELAEEAKSGTLELMLTAPVPLSSLILGKWLASLTISLIMLALTVLYPVILIIYGDPDPGVLATSYLGLFLICASFSAAGLFASSLTKNQMVAGVIGIMLLLPFWLSSSARSLVPESLRPLLDHFSFLEHLRSFSRGVLDTGDLVWFGAFTGVFLFLTWRSIESRRWR